MDCQFYEPVEPSWDESVIFRLVYNGVGAVLPVLPVEGWVILPGNRLPQRVLIVVNGAHDPSRRGVDLDARGGCWAGVQNRLGPNQGGVPLVILQPALRTVLKVLTKEDLVPATCR